MGDVIQIIRILLKGLLNVEAIKRSTRHGLLWVSIFEYNAVLWIIGCSNLQWKWIFYKLLGSILRKISKMMNMGGLRKFIGTIRTWRKYRVNKNLMDNIKMRRYCWSCLGRIIWGLIRIVWYFNTKNIISKWCTPLSDWLYTYQQKIG